MKIGTVLIFVTVFGVALAKPFPQAPAAHTQPPLPLALLMNGMPKSGIAGFGDNMGGALANFGNGQGSAFNAMFSGLFNAIGSFISGIFGSGAINTAFLNYNNLPPPEAPPTTPPVAAAAAEEK